MHCLLPLLLALQSATVIAVLYNDEVMLAVQTQRDVIYTAEFSRNTLGSDSFIDGDRVEAEVRGSTMKVKRKDGKIATGRIIWEQRVLVHPIPSNWQMNCTLGKRLSSILLRNPNKHRKVIDRLCDSL